MANDKPNWLDEIGNDISQGIEDIFNGITGRPNREQREEQNRLVNEQMRAYKEQTELTRGEINRKQDEQRAEKRRIEEKQIRSLRRNYRPAGLLGSQTSNEPIGGLTNKLGA